MHLVSARHQHLQLRNPWQFGSPRPKTCTVETRHACHFSCYAAELMFGLAKGGKPKSLTRLVHGFLDVLATMAWDASAADCYADLRVQLERGGTPIGVLDTMIAAHALALDTILITNNQKHFQRVKALKCENWVR